MSDLVRRKTRWTSTELHRFSNCGFLPFAILSRTDSRVALTSLSKLVGSVGLEKRSMRWPTFYVRLSSLVFALSAPLGDQAVTSPDCQA